MSKWSVVFTREADRDIALLDKSIQRRILGKLDWLEKNFSDISPIVLTADFRDFFKLRISDWRIFYQVDWNQNIITIRYIDHRSKVYKDK